MKCRLYIDEVGTSSWKTGMSPNERYLSLTGIIFGLDSVRDVVFPQFEAFKQNIFQSHPDDPVILHRKELVNKKYPFHVLLNPEAEVKFNDGLLNLLREFDYRVITVVLDKIEHFNRYQVWRYEPYHYALAVMLERYCQWLDQQGLNGDVLAEARYKKADRKLMDSFARIYNLGTDWVPAEVFQRCLTSKKLKIKPKSKNISGLQLADLIAHPSYKATLARYHKQKLPENFGGEIAKILEQSKYYRSKFGRISGYGQKVLP